MIINNFENILEELELVLMDSNYEDFEKNINIIKEKYNFTESDFIESPSKLIFQRSEWQQKIKLITKRKKIELLKEIREEVDYYVKEENCKKRVIAKVLGIPAGYLSKIMHEKDLVSITIEKTMQLKYNLEVYKS